MTTDITISRTDKPNSYEFGKAGNRFKLYFNEVDDLRIQMAELRTLGLIDEPIEPETQP